jgi:hypothetical protein
MAISDPGAGVEVVRIRQGQSRLPMALAGVLAVGLGVALMKPWGEPASSALQSPASAAQVVFGPGPEAPSAAAGVSSGGVPAGVGPAIVVAPAVDEDCYAGTAWRLFTLQRDFGRQARWWLRLETASEATGPLDPGIPVTRVSTQQALGVGFCAPYRSGGGSAVSGVEAWRLEGAGDAIPVMLDPLPGSQPIDGHGGLYAPPTPVALPTGPAWQPGRYVFQVLSREGEASTWFGVVLEAFRPVPG